MSGFRGKLAKPHQRAVHSHRKTFVGATEVSLIATSGVNGLRPIGSRTHRVQRRATEAEAFLRAGLHIASTNTDR